MATRLKLMEIDNTVIVRFEGIYNNWANPLVSNEGFNANVVSILKNLCLSLLNDMKTMGCHVIGKWQYDEETKTWVEMSALTALFHMKLQKYKPYLKVFSDEFVNVSSTIQRVHSGSNDGVSRSASENSPITAAPITSAPTEASQWNIDNPNVKGGTQFNQHHSNTENVTDPRVQLEILKFNVDQLNLTTIANMIVRSVVEEYNTVY